MLISPCASHHAHLTMAPRLMPGQKAAPKEEETPTTADLMSAIRNKGGGGNLKVHPSCASLMRISPCASHHGPGARSDQPGWQQHYSPST